MIIYNMRERGPLQYDKFILNTFQYINMINHYISKVNGIDFGNTVDNFDKVYNDIISLSDYFYIKYKVTET